MPEKESILSPAEATLRSFAIHSRIHLYLLDAQKPAVWTALPSGSKGRTPAAFSCQFHSVRLLWLKLPA